MTIVRPNAGKPPAVPPGGFGGVAQQTPATLATFRGPVSLSSFAMMANGRRGGGGKRRRKAKAKRTTPRRASKRRTARKIKRAARLVKGSAAAKRFMARLRAKRRK